MTCGGLDFENNRRFEKAILRAQNPRQKMKDISFFTRIFLYVFLGFSCIFFASCIIIIIIIIISYPSTFFLTSLNMIFNNLIRRNQIFISIVYFFYLGQPLELLHLQICIDDVSKRRTN